MPDDNETPAQPERVELSPPEVPVLVPPRGPRSARTNQESTRRTLRAVIEGLTHGDDLAPIRNDVERLITSQQDRAELVSNLIQAHDFNRLLEFIEARDKLELGLLEAVYNRESTLQPFEKLAILKYVVEEAKHLTNKTAAVSQSSDIMNILTKVDYAIHAAQQNTAHQLRNTTPQGREIIRRAAFRLSKLARAADKQSVPDDD